VGRTGKHINAFKAGVSYISSRLVRKPYIVGMPVSAGIELTNFCNLKCPECSSGSEKMTRTRGFMDPELYKKFISEAGPYLYNINLYFQGEPMLHPRFFAFTEKSGKIKLTVSTNGHFLSEENSLRLARSGISKLIVSLDGMDNETYSKYRAGGEWEKVTAGIEHVSREIQKEKSKMKLEIQFLVNRYNESQVNQVRKFAMRINASLKLKSMQIINQNNVDQWMPDSDKFRRYRIDENGSFRLKNPLKNNCLRLWMNPVITWDGKVVPCCFDKDADHIMGDLNNMSFREIWLGKKFREFRRSLLENRGKIEICRNCTSGLKGVSF
jgi:radical SAM protein with 4Fe4S-binding SPASM domain